MEEKSVSILFKWRKNLFQFCLNGGKSRWNIGKTWSAVRPSGFSFPSLLFLERAWKFHPSVSNRFRDLQRFSRIQPTGGSSKWPRNQRNVNELFCWNLLITTERLRCGAIFIYDGIFHSNFFRKKYSSMMVFLIQIFSEKYPSMMVFFIQIFNLLVDHWHRSSIHFT